MLIFGHAGFTLGAAALINGALSKGHSLLTRENKVRDCLPATSESAPAGNSTPDTGSSWFISLGNRIDIRLLLIGSLLPDIIDKPIGQFFFKDTFSNGRIFSHTLLFLIVITLAGLYLQRSRGKTWLLLFSFGTFTQLTIDQMWLTPETFLWPLYGFAFKRIDLTHWTQNILYALRTDPGIYVPELIGLGILLWFSLDLLRFKRVGAFIRNGRLIPDNA